MSKHSLKGKAVLIGGGAKDLGGLISRAFAAEGARVCVHYDSSAAKAGAEKTVADIRAAGGIAFAIQGDFAKLADVTAVFAAAKKTFGALDIAINTVDKMLMKPFGETAGADYDPVAAINCKAACFFIQEAGKRLNDGGKICTIVRSLLTAYTGLYSIYSGMKSPVEHFTRAASKDFGPRGISVTAVSPGPADMSLFYGQETPVAAKYPKPASAPGGLAEFEDIVPLVKFLATDGWWITGQTIFANGGILRVECLEDDFCRVGNSGEAPVARIR